MLPLFYEKADTPAMIRHSMDGIRSVTEFLSPGQIAVIAVIAPFFPKPNITMVRTNSDDVWRSSPGDGLVEYAVADLGWTVALTEAGIASSGVAESFLTVSHLTRTQHAHQVTIEVLHKLQKEAYSLLGESTLEAWRLSMIEKGPIFQFWDTVMGIVKLVLMFIDLYIQCLEDIILLWTTTIILVHIRDMKSWQPVFRPCKDFTAISP